MSYDYRGRVACFFAYITFTFLVLRMMVLRPFYNLPQTSNARILHFPRNLLGESRNMILRCDIEKIIGPNRLSVLIHNRAYPRNNDRKYVVYNLLPEKLTFKPIDTIQGVSQLGNLLRSVTTRKTSFARSQTALQLKLPNKRGRKYVRCFNWKQISSVIKTTLKNIDGLIFASVIQQRNLC